MRDRLVKLIEDFCRDKYVEKYIPTQEDYHFCMAVTVFANYLLANGVIVPPVKVGDVVYVGDSKPCYLLKEAIETYGADAQLNVAIEEFAELTKEICKHKRYADNTKEIIEEMADCYIMLEQMKMIFGLDNADISNAMDRKIRRLERRLAEKGGERE